MNKIPDYKVTDEDEDGRGYVLLESFVYYSPRYHKFISAEKGYPSDGATGAFDVRSLSWWVHDVLCERGTFDDGSPCNNWMASSILSDILADEGRWARARYWFVATWVLGGGEARKNGMW